MTDKARELLEKVISNLYQHDDILYGTVQEIRVYLAEPEVKREALTMRDVASQFVAPCEFDWHAFWDGIRFAEKHHGIGGGE